MEEYKDFVYAENTKNVDTEHITTQIKGLFIGTQKYFFFFPQEYTVFNHGHSSQKADNTTYTYQGKSVTEYVLDALFNLNEVHEFEELITNQLFNEIGESFKIFPIEDLSSFKVQAGFFGSGVIVRYKDTEYKGLNKFSATMVAISLGAKKKQIKSFYSTHPKFAAK